MPASPPAAPLRVLLFTDADVFAGTERHMLDLARGLIALGQQVRIACPRPGVLADRAAAAGVDVLPIAKRGAVDRAAVAALAPLLRSGDIDVIHAHNGRTHVAAAFAVKKAGRGACVTTQHFLSPARTTRRGVKALVANYLHHKAARHTAHTVAISDAVRAAALARRDCPPAAITTVHNGIYPPDLANAQDAAPLRQSLNLRPDDPFVFCAARLQAEKDIGTLVTAMAAVAAAHPTARCLIAGDGDLRPALQQQIDALQLGQSVTLLGFRNDIPALLRACDLFVLPSLAEPFGLAVVEAMALARPVIATDAGGPREIVDAPRTGLLVPPANAAALAGAINSLLADPARRAAVGQAAHARFLTHFTASRMARDILGIYQRALAPAPQTPVPAV